LVVERGRVLQGESANECVSAIDLPDADAAALDAPLSVGGLRHGR